MTKNNFDLLRHVFAFVVVWHHFNVLTGYRVSFIPFEIINSDVAVKGFFVISGLLIWISAINTKYWQAFFIKRAFRIYPALIFILLISSLVSLIYFDEPVDDVLRYFSWNSVFLSFKGKCISDMFDTNVLCAVNGSLWTLKLEVAYYMFIGIIMFCFKKWAYSLVVTFTILSFILESSLLLAPKSYSSLVSIVENQIPFKFYYFGLGVIFYNYHEQISSRTLLWLLLISFLGWYILSVEFIFLPLFVISLVFLLAFRLRSVNFSKHGDLSYGMYIFHFPVIQFMVSEKLFLGVWFIDFILSIGIVLALSKLSWCFIESESILWARKLTSKVGVK